MLKFLCFYPHLIFILDIFYRLASIYSALSFQYYVMCVLNIKR